MRSHSREHPQKDELERFKTELRMKQEERLQGYIMGRRISPQIENPNDLFRFPELKFNMRVDRSPSPTRIVILKPASEAFWPWSPGIPMREDERERPKSGVKVKGENKICRREKITEASSSSVFCKPRNINTRKSTRSTEKTTGSFIHEANFSRVPIGKQDNSQKIYEPAVEEEKPKRDFFNFKWRIRNWKHLLVLRGKFFTRKNPMKDDPSEMISIELHGKVISTEEPTSPASNQWKPIIPSLSPLEMTFNDDLPPQVQEESSSDNSEVQEPSEEAKYLRRILLAAGVYNQPLSQILASCYSLKEPLTKLVFDIVEKDYSSIPGKRSKDTGPSRRLLFHLLNEQVLRLITTTEFSFMKRKPQISGKELTKCLLEQVERCLGFVKGRSISLENLMCDDLRVSYWKPLKGFDDVGEALERMIIAQLVDEFVKDLCYQWH